MGLPAGPQTPPRCCRDAQGRVRRSPVSQFSSPLALASQSSALRQCTAAGRAPGHGMQPPPCRRPMAPAPAAPASSSAEPSVRPCSSLSVMHWRCSRAARGPMPRPFRSCTPCWAACSSCCRAQSRACAPRAGSPMRRCGCCPWRPSRTGAGAAGGRPGCGPRTARQPHQAAEAAGAAASARGLVGSSRLSLLNCQTNFTLRPYPVTLQRHRPQRRLTLLAGRAQGAPTRRRWRQRQGTLHCRPFRGGMSAGVSAGPAWGKSQLFKLRQMMEHGSCPLALCILACLPASRPARQLVPCQAASHPPAFSPVAPHHRHRPPSQHPAPPQHPPTPRPRTRAARW